MAARTASRDADQALGAASDTEWDLLADFGDGVSDTASVVSETTCASGEEGLPRTDSPAPGPREPDLLPTLRAVSSPRVACENSREWVAANERVWPRWASESHVSVLGQMMDDMRPCDVSVLSPIHGSVAKGPPSGFEPAAVVPLPGARQGAHVVLEQHEQERLDRWCSLSMALLNVSMVSVAAILSYLRADPLPDLSMV